MASSPKPTVAEVAAYTEDELEQFLAKSGNTVKLQDPENIPFDLIERLKTAHKRLHGASKNRAVDLDQVAARLQAVSSRTDGTHETQSPCSTERESTPKTQEEEDRYMCRQELKAYHDLIKQGGRSPFPLHLVEEIYWNPDNFLEHEKFGDAVHRVRQSVMGDATKSFFCQRYLAFWETFLTLQRNIRIRSYPDESSFFRMRYPPEIYEKTHGPISGPWTFARHQKAIEVRLVKHGFTRPLQLQEDISQQDKLTTWLEYLGCEYREYDQATKTVEKFLPRLEDARKRMADLGHVQSHETYDDLRWSESLLQHVHAVKCVSSEVKAAQRNLDSIERTIADSPGSQAKLQEQLKTTREALRAAQKEQQTIRERSASCAAFHEKVEVYCKNRDTVNREGPWLRWMERQIPEIEAELGGTMDVKSTTEQRDCPRGVKRAREETTEDVQLSPAGSPSKSRRRNASEDSQSAKGSSKHDAGPRRGSHASPAGQSPMQSLAAKRGPNPAPDDVSTNVPPPAPRRSSRKTRSAKETFSERNSQTTQPLRRSARIAQRYKESSSKAPANATQTKQRPKRQAAQRQKAASQNHGKKGAPKKGKRRGR